MIEGEGELGARGEGACAGSDAPGAPARTGSPCLGGCPPRSPARRALPPCKARLRLRFGVWGTVLFGNVASRSTSVSPLLPTRPVLT